MIRKIIYWGESFTSIHLLVSYNQRTIADYQKMADLIRETFPFIANDQLHCSVVTQSDHCDGATLLWYNGPIPKKHYEGWLSVERQPDYHFA